MRIWVISQAFKPEPCTPSVRLASLAKQWQKSDIDVSVLTAMPSYPNNHLYEPYQNKSSFMTEEIDGVHVYRHWLHLSPEKTTKSRLIRQATFALSLLKNIILPSGGSPDVIIASSPSFIPTISAWVLSLRFGAKFIFEVRELWPSSFIELGLLKDGKILDFLIKVEMFLYKRADAIITVTDKLAESLVSRGIPRRKIHVISNGADDDEIIKTEQALKDGSVERLRTELQISPMTKVVMYMGEHENAQALGQVIDAAKMLLSRSDILFLLVGDGSDKQRLKSISRGLPNMQFIHTQDLQRNSTFYGLADICLIPLKDIEGLKSIIPPKLFESMSSGKPCIASAAGETAEAINKSRTALIVPPENSEKIAYAILKLIDNPDKAKLLGLKGQKWVSDNFLYSKLANDYLNVLKNTLGIS